MAPHVSALQFLQISFLSSWNSSYQTLVFNNEQNEKMFETDKHESEKNCKLYKICIK